MGILSQVFFDYSGRTTEQLVPALPVHAHGAQCRRAVRGGLVLGGLLAVDYVRTVSACSTARRQPPGRLRPDARRLRLHDLHVHAAAALDGASRCGGAAMSDTWSRSRSFRTRRRARSSIASASGCRGGRSAACSRPSPASASATSAAASTPRSRAPCSSEVASTVLVDVALAPTTSRRTPGAARSRGTLPARSRRCPPRAWTSS